MTTQAIAQAIARMENVDPRYNNPGGIMDLSTGRLRVFPTQQAGWDALYNQINLNISRGLTLEEFFAGKPGVYAGYSSDTPYYASTVSGWLGVPENVPLVSLLNMGSGQPSAVSAANLDWTGLLSWEAPEVPAWAVALGLGAGLWLLSRLA